MSQTDPKPETKETAPKLSRAERPERHGVKPSGDERLEADAYDRLTALQDAREGCLELPVVVTESQFELFQSYRPGMTAADMVNEGLADFGRGPDWDRAVWHGTRCVAIIRRGPDGNPEVVRLDGPAPVVTKAQARFTY